MAIFPLSFSQLAETLEAIHAIAPERQPAFRARIKNLQRLGFPPGINTGKGQRAEYGVEQMLLIALAIELLQLGLTPERASGALMERRDAVINEFKRACGNRNLISIRPASFMYLDPRGLIDLQDEKLFKAKVGHDYEPVFFGAASDLGRHFKRHPSAVARLAVLDLTRVISDVVLYVSPGDEMLGEQAISEIIEWAFSK